MTVKDKVQKLIEINQQRRVAELIDTVDHVFDKFENLLDEDMWDTDIVNGKPYLQKTVSGDDKLHFLCIGLTDDGVVIQAVLPPCLDNVDVLTYKPRLAEIFQIRTSGYEYPIRLVICFPTESNNSEAITFDTEEISAETNVDEAKERIYRITDKLIDGTRALNETLDPKNGYMRDYAYGPLRRLVVTQAPVGVNVIGITRDLSIVDNNDIGLRKAFETRLRNCAFKYHTTVTFTLCFHPAITSWAITVNKEDHE